MKQAAEQVTAPMKDVQTQMIAREDAERHRFTLRPFQDSRTESSSAWTAGRDRRRVPNGGSSLRDG